jgi:hypothetical protein
MSRDPLPPVLLGDVRRLGFPIHLCCPVCNHSAAVPIGTFAALPEGLTVLDLGHAVRCSRCGRRGGASAHPHHRLWVAYQRQTGQRHRLPYWMPFMREADDAAALEVFAERGELP